VYKAYLEIKSNVVEIKAISFLGKDHSTKQGLTTEMLRTCFKAEKLKW